MTLKPRSPQAAAFNARQAAKLSAGDVVDITKKLEERKAEEKAKKLEQLESLLQDTASVMLSDPGFQQAVRKREAEQKMMEYAAGPPLFKKGDRVAYAGDDEAIPADWVGTVIEHEPTADHNMNPSTGEVVETLEHNYIVKWRNPQSHTSHEGIHHQDELKKATRGRTSASAKPTVSAATNMHPDQLAIMRFISKSGKDKVTVKEIEKSRFGNTPWFKAWLQKKQPKKDVLVSADDIGFAEVELPETEPRNLVKDMLHYSQPVTLNWNSEYSLFDDNKIFGLAIEERRVPTLFAPFGPQAVQFIQGYNDKARMSGHPTVPGKVILAWVRYSEMDDGTLWVHEVQTDMFWAVGARHVTQNDAREAYSRGGAYSKEANYYIRDIIKQRADDQDRQMQLLEFEVMKEFVASHPDKRIVFPTPKYRMEHYPADMFGDKAAPASVYNEIPKKMRFEKKPVEELAIEEAPAGEVWVYATAGQSAKSVGQAAKSGESMSKVSASFAAVSRAVRAFLSEGSATAMLQASTSVEVDGLVKAVAADDDMASAVVAALDGEANRLGLAKLKVLADESGSEEAKKLFTTVIATIRSAELESQQPVKMLHEKIADVLAVPEEDVLGLPLKDLIEEVRPISRRLAAEIEAQMASGRVLAQSR